eukprot:COSAG05_NODE_660_length_8054_cov_3.180264_5_plen_161_part_00
MLRVVECGYRSSPTRPAVARGMLSVWLLGCLRAQARLCCVRRFVHQVCALHDFCVPNCRLSQCPSISPHILAIALLGGLLFPKVVATATKPCWLVWLGRVPRRRICGQRKCVRWSCRRFFLLIQLNASDDTLEQCCGARSLLSLALMWLTKKHFFDWLIG